MIGRRLGARGPVVTAVGLGCAPIGNLYTAVGDAEAAATVDAAWQAGVRYFDTAPLYGHGLSERRLGAALARHPRDSYVLSTKVGRLLRPPGATRAESVFASVPDVEPVFDFSRDGVLRSIDESLLRLDVDHIDVVLVHDPDDHEAEAMVGAFPTLIDLRDQGVIGAVGAGMNQAEMLDRFVQRVDLDCVLLAGRYTLLDRTGAESLLPRCVERGVGVVLGGVFNSGLLVDPDAHPTYDYGAVPPEIAARARRMRSVCQRHGIALPAAAVRFALAHPAVTALLVGARTPGEVDADVAFAAATIPDAFWTELDAAW